MSFLRSRRDSPDQLAPGISPVLFESVWGKDLVRSVTIHSVVVVAPDVVSCDIACDAAILNLKSGVYYGLNAVGARVWSCIQSPVALSQIKERLLEQYDVDAEECEQDLLDLADGLLRAGLIDVQNETTP